MTARWRMQWRTRQKIPANRDFRCGLENRYPSLGGSRVRIPPPPLEAKNRMFMRFLAFLLGSRRSQSRARADNILGADWRTTGARWDGHSDRRSRWFDSKEG